MTITRISNANPWIKGVKIVVFGESSTNKSGPQRSSCWKKALCGKFPPNKWNIEEMGVTWPYGHNMVSLRYDTKKCIAPDILLLI